MVSCLLQNLVSLQVNWLHAILGEFVHITLLILREVVIHITHLFFCYINSALPSEYIKRVML